MRKTKKDSKNPSCKIINCTEFCLALGSSERGDLASISLVGSFSSKQVAQGQYVVSDTHCPALHGCKSEWEAGQRPRSGQSPVEHMGLSFVFWAAAPKGTKSCSTKGDFRSYCLKKWMRCYRGLQEPKLRSKTADVRPKSIKLRRLDSWFEAWEV